MAPALTHSRSNDELREFAHEHLVYEARMLVYAVAEMRGLRKGPERNAYLESFAVHARCLRDFFWGKRDRKRKQEDAYAFDYCASGVWEARYPEASMPRALKNIDDRLRIGREVVHLSYRRLDVRGKGWHPQAVLREIAAPLDTLADLALPARMDGPTRAALRDPETFGREAGAASVATGGSFAGTIPVATSRFGR